MTTLPEVSSSQRLVTPTINDNFQSVSPAAAFGIDWRNTEALTLGIFGGVLPDGSEIAAQTKALSASQTNYVERTDAGVVSVNTSAYTAGAVRMFRIVTNANGITSYTDDRSFMVPGSGVSGPTSATDNAIARFDGTSGTLLQNSVVTIGDTGAIAGAISLSISQGTITDPANAFTVASTWNDAADTFVGTSIDITDTASAAASLIARWRVGGSDMASISKAGLLTLAGNLFVNGGNLASTSTTFNLAISTATTINIGSTGATTVRIGAAAANYGFSVGSVGNIKYNFGGTITSSGVGTTAAGINFNVDITGAAGDTAYLAFFANSGSITTQGASETIAVVATMRLGEPVITVGTGDTITLASTLHIGTVPTEGVTNAALSITSGNFLTGGSVHAGSVTAPVSQFDISASSGGVLTLRRIDTNVAANEMVGKLQFYAADTSTTTNFIVADIEAQATNSISTDINPGRLIFRTTGTGVAATPTERMRIDEAGLVGVVASILAHNATAIPAGGTAGAGLLVSSTANFGVFFGSGAPSLSAAKGSLYLRSDGSGTNDRAYINTNGTTTWTPVVTVA